MKKINIYHLSPFPYHSGGIDTWLYNFILHNDGNFKIDLYCPRSISKKAIFDIAHFKNCDVHYLDSYSGYASYFKWALSSFNIIRKIVDRTATNLVLSTIPTLMPIVLLKYLGVLKGKILCSHRGVLLEDAVKMGKSSLYVKAMAFAESSLLKVTDLIVANGWDTQEMLKRYYGVDSVVIPNAIDSAANRPSCLEDPDLSILSGMKSSNVKILMHVGTLRTIKGIDHIINAAVIFMKRHNDKFVLVFVGKGNIDKYKEVAARHGIPSVFVGEKNNVLDYYSIADAVVNVSGGSGVSNSLLETLALGKIVVCWDKHTFSQVVQHGVNGYLAAYGDDEALADKWGEALNNVNGVQAEVVRKSVEKFNWRAINSEWHKLL